MKVVYPFRLQDARNNRAAVTDTDPSPPRPCPVTFALEIFGDRWTLLLLRDVLLEGLSRYGDLRAANPGIATNILADRLKRLERRGLLEKFRDPKDARQFVYRPTEFGISTVPMLLEMIVWGTKQGQGAADPELLVRFDADRDGLVRDLQRRIRERLKED